MRVNLDSKQQQRDENGTRSTEDDDEDNVMQRVNLIETSLLYQSDELLRAKTGFLKVKSLDFRKSFNNFKLCLSSDQQRSAATAEGVPATRSRAAGVHPGAAQTEFFQWAGERRGRGGGRTEPRGPGGDEQQPRATESLDWNDDRGCEVCSRVNCCERRAA
jgi:hypothetical protein